MINECSMNTRARSMVNAKVSHLQIPTEQIVIFVIDHQFLQQQRNSQSLVFVSWPLHQVTWSILSSFITSRWKPCGALPALEKRQKVFTWFSPTKLGWNLPVWQLKVFAHFQWMFLQSNNECDLRTKTRTIKRKGNRISQKNKTKQNTMHSIA